MSFPIKACHTFQLLLVAFRDLSFSSGTQDNDSRFTLLTPRAVSASFCANTPSFVTWTSHNANRSFVLEGKSARKQKTDLRYTISSLRGPRAFLSVCCLAGQRHRTSTKMYLDDAVDNEHYVQGRGRSCSVHRAGRRYADEMDTPSGNSSPDDRHFRSGQLIVADRSRSRSTVRVSDQKFLVRVRSSNQHLRPPDYDRGQSRSRDQSRSRTRNRHSNGCRSRSGRSSSSSSRRSDGDQPTRPVRPERSPSRNQNRCSPSPRHVNEISRKTVTRYAVDPALSRGSRHSHHHRSRSQHQQTCDNLVSDRRMIRVEASRTTFVKVRTRDICPESLDHFGFPWEWSSVCTSIGQWVSLKADELQESRDTIIIRRSCSQAEIDALCRHTRSLIVVRKQVTVSKPMIITRKSTTLRPNAHDSSLMVVRKRSAMF